MSAKVAVAAAAVAALAVVAVLVARGQGPNGPALPAEYYGVDGHVLRLMAGDGKLALLNEQLDQVERVGVTFVRANLDWLQLEPQPPSNGRRAYDFTSHDEWVAALARHNLRWYVIGVGTPAWATAPESDAAGCGIFGPPAHARDYAALMAAIAARYGRGGTFWAAHPELPYRPVIDYEIWNEPNLGGFWCPRPDPSAYARLLETASAAIRNVDPGARIVFGGLAPFAQSQPATATTRAHDAAGEFMAEVRSADQASAPVFDVLGAHAYGTPDVVLGELAAYRRALDGLGLAAIPISLNETGWPTQGQGAFTNVPEDTRAAYLRDVTERTALSGCDVDSFAPHTWVTDEADPTDQEDWFGLADPRTGQPYPSALAYEDEIGLLPAGKQLPAKPGNCGG